MEVGDDNEGSNSQGGMQNDRPRKIRDLFADRVVGIVTGAAIPVVLLLVPLVNKYLDNSKEIQTAQIKENSDDIDEMKNRLGVLTQVIVNSQMQIQVLSAKLSDCEKHVKDEK